MSDTEIIKIIHIDDEIVAEAKARFKRCEEWESKARANYAFDTKFAAADAHNHYQWPDEILSDRTRSKRPTLTINKVRQHVLQIVNDQRQNQSQIEIRPVGNGASYDAAQIFEGVVRHIENVSNAQSAYNNACFTQVVGGIGYWRIVTDWSHDGSFDQEIFIRRVSDPMSVFLDPDIAESDASDSRFGFVFEDMPYDDFKGKYGKRKAENVGSSPFGSADYDGTVRDGWQSKDTIRVCEYYRKVYKSDKLHELDNNMTIKESDVVRHHKLNDDDLRDTLKDHSIRSREIETPQIEWFLIAGSEIIERRDWLGAYVPIIRVVGEQIEIDKTMDRRGHVRMLIDPQRMLNYWSSSAVEFVALQSKIPFVAAAEAIAGFEDDWAHANTRNAAYLPYNSLGENSEPIPKPERAPPPVMAPAYLHGIELAKQDMMASSGQYEASMGAKSNEISGKAVDARQRQGENSTYHFIARFGEAIRHTGRCLIDLVPKIYDSERIIKILAVDGAQHTVSVDPNHPQAHSQLQDPDGENFDPQAISAIFNPNVGKYEVFGDIGPAYGSRRQDTFNAITEIIKTNESLLPVVGDLLMQAADFPLSKELAQRLRNMVPKQALGQQPPDPQIAQLQHMLANQHLQIQQLKQDLQVADSKQMATEQQKSIEVYKSETERMKAIGMIDPAAMMPIIRQMVSEVLGTPANPIIAAHAQEQSMLEAQAQHMINQLPLPPQPPEGNS